MYLCIYHLQCINFILHSRKYWYRFNIISFNFSFLDIVYLCSVTLVQIAIANGEMYVPNFVTISYLLLYLLLYFLIQTRFSTSSRPIPMYQSKKKVDCCLPHWKSGSLSGGLRSARRCSSVSRLCNHRCVNEGRNFHYFTINVTISDTFSRKRDRQLRTLA